MVSYTQNAYKKQTSLQVESLSDRELIGASLKALSHRVRKIKENLLEENHEKQPSLNASFFSGVAVLVSALQDMSLKDLAELVQAQSDHVTRVLIKNFHNHLEAQENLSKIQENFSALSNLFNEE